MPNDPPAPGQESGHAFSWRTFVDSVAAERGSLAQAAALLAERRGFTEDIESVERGLRRLRERGGRDGGVWGQRALRCFGLPRGVTDRIRWMGQYHSRFTDLPASVAEELLRPWDRPPISESPARIWLLLARAGLSLRRREDPAAVLQQAARVDEQAETAARVELALVQAFAFGRTDPVAAGKALDRAGDLIHSAANTLAPDDHACLFARYIDQRAYPLNKPMEGAPDHDAALQLYLQIPTHGPAFARCRRENGLGHTRLRLGQRNAALEHARASVQASGDSGSLRMRAMALKLLASASEGDAASLALDRARAIAEVLEDEALRTRFRAR